MDGADERIPLLVIAGPTAVGKTELSLRVAEALNGEIVSGDSAAVYRGLDIGSAKPSREDRERIPHHLVDVVGADEAFSVADYQRLAQAAVQDIWARGRRPIVVGGTGLWIRALVRHFNLPQDAGETALRQQLTAIGERDGFESLRRQLRVVDPESYRAIQPNDHRRIVRALEVFQTTGRRLVRAAPQHSPYNTCYWVLTRSVSDLRQRIQDRVEAMLAKGLVDEVIHLLQQGVSPQSQSLSAIGYKETLDWYYGRLTADERDRLIVRHTQLFAKRQLTWFRSEKDARWLDLSAWPLDRAVEKILEVYRQNT
ncbi:tRNA (adenosine(37)-N6)-dimethylallyltransferase MiaA [Sulfobacillus harzensis]|uniref:tRNA dimethylallyltransferase n=1 Tax=Sulfobacillus harzensis TaxID=2729629 RepID=A0A7Y0L0L1_9FIRM|nr:tRNA (adenosine(37)-N6)-dimethylallyltransferase MiaA [Sulfobacillus harzensis]NMP20833.1 tRNA (adenosine(37)-N6)-dimethylallyltransferase MiaA [Sulfobacillus harzensis]